MRLRDIFPERLDEESSPEGELYLRFGDLPKTGRSGRQASHWISAYLSDRTEEMGVSVYPIHWDSIRNRWSIECGNHATLDQLFAEKRPAFLVTGEHIVDDEEGDAYGEDGEPLLKDVKIVREVPYDKLYVPEWGSDPLPEEYLVDYSEEDDADEETSLARYYDDLNRRGKKETGEAVLIRPDGHALQLGVQTLGLGDKTRLLRATYGFAQGPAKVEWCDSRWNLYWGAGEHREPNRRATEITGHPMEGNVLLIRLP
jgi:hypothetical protein